MARKCTCIRCRAEALVRSIYPKLDEKVRAVAEKILKAMRTAYTTPETLARHLGWSERRVGNKARELGACQVSRNRMVLLPQDVDAIMEATCPSKFSRAAKFGAVSGRSHMVDRSKIL
jgi:hypothetical protein